MNLFFYLAAMRLMPNIKNMDYPICKTCIHFLTEKRPTGSEEFGKCKLFGEKNILTGEIKYDYAELCRLNNNKCNITGNYYESTNKYEL